MLLANPAMNVSVIIRTYNRAYILGEAIASAIQQTVPPLEVIVVDDGSTDATSEVVRAFQDDRIRLIKHEANRGVGAAGNTGVSAARGELIAFLDSDDLWEPDKLEKQLAFLERHPEVDILFSDVVIVDGEVRHPSMVPFMKAFPKLLARTEPAADHIFSGKDVYLCLLEEVPIKTNSLLLKRRVFETAGWFDSQCRSGEDWELLLRVSPFATFGYIDQALAIQRWSPDATHRRYLEQDKLFLLGTALEHKGRLSGQTEALKAVNRAILDHCSNLGCFYMNSGQRSRAIAKYVQGFRETGAVIMLLRAASVLLPLAWRSPLRSVFRKRRLARPHDVTI